MNRISAFFIFILILLLNSCKEEGPASPEDFDSGWEILNTNHKYTFLKCFFSDENHGWILASMDSIFCTTDGGDSWEAHHFEKHMSGSSRITLQFADSLNGWAMQGEYKSELQRTSDGGKTWTKIGILPTLFQNHTFQALQFLDNNNGFAICNDAYDFNDNSYSLLFKTGDGGNSWSYKIFKPDSVGGKIRLFYLNFFDLKKGILFGRMENEISTSKEYIIYGTEDGGMTWKKTPTKYFDNDITALAFLDDKTGWIASDNELFKTTNAGISWFKQLDNPEYIYEIQFVDEMNGWLRLPRDARSYVAKRKNFMRTTNGGLSWHYVSAPYFEDKQYSSYNDIFFINNRRGWAVGDGGIVIRTDNGGVMFD